MPQEPMIIVRKPDGSKVKMTLAEFRASKMNVTQPKAPPHVAMPVSRVARSTKATGGASQSGVWDKDDHLSLMDNSSHHDELVPMQMNTQSMPKKTMVVRDDISTMTTDVPTYKKINQVQSPSVNTRSAKPVPEELSRLIESARERPIIQDIRGGDRSSTRQMKKSMGPVDELGAMTLIDMHRLGSTSEGVKTAMIQKFETLKKDAFISYLDAVHAWEMSPIYKAYVSVLEQALKNRQSIVEYTDAHKSGNELTAEDVSVVYAVSAHVRL